MRRIAILGAGGHAKVVYEALKALGETSIQIFDSNPDLHGKAFLDTHIQGDYAGDADVIHIAIGRADLRQKLAERYHQPLLTIIHPDASVSPSARIAPGVFIAAKAVIGPDARIGKCSIINHGAVVDHDDVIGDWCHIAPNATLCGHVEIGESTLVGAGSTIIPLIQVGSACLIGAGAVVTKNIESSQKIIGVA